jgi:hypothetical protein
LEASGTWASFQLLTTGDMQGEMLDHYAETLLTGNRPLPDTDVALAAFTAASLRSTPYAYARDITGETVLPLIEGDPMAGQAQPPLLSDADWLRLQGICGG